MVMNGQDSFQVEVGFSIDKKGVYISRPCNPVLRHSQTSDLYRGTCRFDPTIITRRQIIENLDFKVEIIVYFIIQGQYINI